MIYILFGEMGVGKNYVGERLAQYLGCEFFDGDTVIPESMQRQIGKFKILTPEMVRNFIYNHLIPEVLKKSKNSTTGNLVVAQALYRREFRNSLTKLLGEENVIEVYIPAPPFTTHMARLLKRKDGIRWMLFCWISKFFFQKPGRNSIVIMNRDEDNLNAQIERLIDETTQR